MRWFATLPVLALLLILPGCASVLFGGVNLLSQRSGVDRAADISFDPAHHLALDVYRPVGASAAPTVVFFYGGSWKNGERWQYRFVGEALAAHGVVAIIPDYRTYPNVRFPAFVDDAARAVEWARAHAAEYGGNPNHLFIMGHSAGAHIAAMLATDARYLAAVGLKPRDLAGFIGLAGPYDFLPLTSEDLLNIFGRDPAEQRASQPVNFVDGDEPPMLLLQGSGDHTVAPRNAKSLAAKMHAQNEPVELTFYPGIGHIGLLLALSKPGAGRAPALQDALRFIEAHSCGEAR